MLFNSLSFLYFFLPITFFIFWKLTSKKQRYVWLTVSGYIFYSFWNYKFCLLMALSTIVSYFAGLGSSDGRLCARVGFASSCR